MLVCLTHIFLVAACAGTDSRPHILFLLADDLGWNDVSYHNGMSGPGATFTPTIDRLASEGVKLLSYYVNPICSPTRASIMTGRYTIRTGISHHCYETMTGLPRNERLLPQAMREAGYETWLTGKWHLGFSERYMIPSERGFDYTYGHYHACVDAFNHTSGNACTPEECKGVDWTRAESGSDPVVAFAERGQHTTHLIVQEIDNLLEMRHRRASTKPVFLYVPFHMVHEGSGNGALSWPHSGFDAEELQAPKHYVDAVPSSVTDPKRRVFVAMVTLLDEAIRNITKLFEDRGLWNNTITIFSTDNGSPFDGRGQVGNLPLRGQKHELYEGGIHVPAFVHGVGVPVGQTSDSLIAHVDWFPTIVRLVGGSTSQELPLDGLDQWASIVAGRASRTELLHNYDLSTSLVKNFVGALRMGNYKLIRLGGKENGEHTSELYDIKADPAEKHNLRHNASFAHIYDRMQKRIDELAKEVVPCWCNESSPIPGVCAGTGFSGDCDKNQPTCSKSDIPRAYLPGWCANEAIDSLPRAISV